MGYAEYEFPFTYDESLKCEQWENIDGDNVTLIPLDEIILLQNHDDLDIKSQEASIRVFINDIKVCCGSFSV